MLSALTSQLSESAARGTSMDIETFARYTKMGQITISFSVRFKTPSLGSASDEGAAEREKGYAPTALSSCDDFKNGQKTPCLRTARTYAILTAPAAGWFSNVR